MLVTAGQRENTVACTARSNHISRFINHFNSPQKMNREDLPLRATANSSLLLFAVCCLSLPSRYASRLRVHFMPLWEAD